MSYSNDIINEEKRSEWPDEIFGIPELRKYPMPDEKHTRSAIKFFNYVDPEHEEELAKNIIKNMKKYNIDPKTVGEKNRLRKYLPKNLMEYVLDESYITESIKNAVNDNGEKVPEICPECGHKIAVFFRGEPVYLCTNCEKYFGVMPFNSKKNKSVKESIILREGYFRLLNDYKDPKNCGWDEECTWTSIDDCIKYDTSLDKSKELYVYDMDPDTYKKIYLGSIVVHDSKFEWKKKVVSEYGTTIGTMAPTNSSDNVKVSPNRLMNTVFSGEELESILGDGYKEKLTAIQEIVESSLKGDSKVYIPVLEYYTEGRLYNYYRDFDGVFVLNELTGYRSKSHDTIFDISYTEHSLIENGIY